MLIQSIQNIAEDSATSQKHLLRWFMFFLVYTPEGLSVSEREDMLSTYQNLADIIDGSKKEVSHV